MTHADDLMSRALSDPQGALEEGGEMLSRLGESEHAERSQVLRAMSMAARHGGDLDDSIGFADLAAGEGAQADSEELRLLGLLTMSGSLAIAQQTDRALEIVEGSIDEITDPHMRARFVFQHAALLVHNGEVRGGIEVFTRVLEVFRENDDVFSVGLTLNRLGQLYLGLGALDDAEHYFSEALDLAESTGERASMHGIQRNLGIVAAYRGDIPLALDWLQRSDTLYMETTGANAPQHVARSEILITVGLFEEAYDLARQIGASAAGRHDLEHQADALLVAARAALLAGRAEDAAVCSSEAATIFTGSGDTPRALEAELLSIDSQFARDGGSAMLLDRAEAVASTLADEGVEVAAAQARLICARIADAIGAIGRERSALESVMTSGTGPVELRIQSSLAKALLQRSAGDPGGALRSVRTGLNLIDRYQAALAATDLRLGIERHGADLAALGLELVLESGKPRRTLEWLDRGRGRAIRYRPVVPTGDDRQRANMADLRRVEAELRRPEKRADPELIRERRRLQEDITSSDRLRREGAGAAGGFTIPRLLDQLGERAMFEIGSSGDRLFAIIVQGGRARRIELGSLAECADELRQVRFGMRRSALRGREFSASSLARLDRLLFGSIRLVSSELVIVPPPSLMSMPWSVLSSLRGISVSVAPSAETWWLAEQRSPVSRRVVVAVGPDLGEAESELRGVGALHPECEIFPTTAPVSEIEMALDGAGLAHVACHASFSVENPMFSSLRLGDGNLNVYDIERLENPPSVVVLSACDSGYTETRAGQELAGLTSALLSIGTRSVVASVGLVPDTPATSELMIDLHRGLLEGLVPAKALARAQELSFDDPGRIISAASFICVGA
ncbi:MAG: CHAT domain-containing tetratricopeptide repeat protein [Acidimicrobiia bacterium]